MCDSAESSLIQKLSYLQFEDDRANNGRLSSSSRPEAQVPVPRAVGAIESFIEPDNHRTALPQDYKVYERENIIASARFATPKPVEQIDEQHHQHLHDRDKKQSPVYENIEYYPQHGQTTYPPYYHPVESRRSSRESPRTSIAGEQYDPGYKVKILYFREMAFVMKYCVFKCYKYLLIDKKYLIFKLYNFFLVFCWLIFNY